MKKVISEKNMTYLLHTAASYNISLLKQELGIHMKILKMVHSETNLLLLLVMLKI